MDKRELIETLVELLDEAEIGHIVEKAIQDNRARLTKLEQLSVKLTIPLGSASPVEGSSRKSEQRVTVNAGDVTAVEAICRILKEANKPMANQAIRHRYFEIYNNTISASTIGNTLWRHKGKLFRKDGRGGTRWAKWKLIKDATH